MILAGKGRLAAIFVKKLHFLKDMKVSYFTPEQQESLNKEWFEDRPAKIYLKKGKPPEVLDGRHRSLYFVLIGKPDYMVPVEFYTDDLVHFNGLNLLRIPLYYPIVPATTVSHLYTTHSQYLDVENSSHIGFRKALNEVMPRLYKMGYWRDLYVEHTQEASKGYIALPQDTDSIVAGVIDNNAVPTRSLWHDYKLFGTTDDDDTLLSSFIDDGYHTTYRDLGGTVSDYYQLKITDIGPNTSNYIFQHADAKIFVTCKVVGDPNNPITIELNNASEQLSQKLSTNQDIYSIERIYYEGIPSGHLTRLTAVYKTQTDATKDVILADIPSGQGEIRYRRYRIGGTDSGSSAHILTKRRWVPLNININTDSSEDPVYVPDDAIVKHALLGKLSEDNADIQRATYHWGVCEKLLEEDTDSFRGAAKPTLHIAPNGVGSGMRGMY